MPDDQDPIAEEPTNDADSRTEKSELPSALDGALDRGLERAFGERSSERQGSDSPTIIQRIGEITGQKPSVSLREVDAAGPTPLLKPLTSSDGIAQETGKYTVHGMLGQGGVGTVHKGHDTDLGRDVAIKFLHEKYASEPSILHRFVEEAQIGGQLQHPGIVPVYELGMTDGRPFFAMKMIKGQTLAKQLADRNAPADDRRAFLSIFEDICQTMAYAHARGVVHRDLKPANVMIGGFGEVQVVDWGMGKVLPQGGVADEKHAAERQSRLSVIETARSLGHGTKSVIGSVMGTPAYMPPEQARGDVDAMDARSDVFALGAILCEILTGQPPYVGEPEDVLGMAAMARLDDAYARLRACGSDEVVAELAVQCMAPTPAARPESASHIAAQISAYLESVEDRARQAELRATEARYQHRMTLIGAAAAVLVLVLGAGTWLWLDAAAQERRDQALARVSEARSVANGALGKAEASGTDPELWNAALAYTEQVVALCADEAVDSDIRDQAAAALAQVQERQRSADAEARRLARDEAMLEALETARIPLDEFLNGDDGWRREYIRLDGAYAQAFKTYLGDVPLFDGAIEDVLASLRRGDIEEELAASLDHWGLIRDGSLRNDEEPNTPRDTNTDRIRSLAVRLDLEDPWRVRLRALLPDAANQGESLRQIAEQADFDTLSAAGYRVLAHALWLADQKNAAVRALRRGLLRHPQDFDLAFSLGILLAALPKPSYEDAAGTHRVAHAIRPDQNEALHRQGMALEALHRYADAEQLYRILIDRDDQNGHWHYHLGCAVGEQDRRAEAIASYRRAIQRDPDDAICLNNLGATLSDQGENEEAIAILHRGIKLDPTIPDLHLNLGNALRNQGKPDAAIDSYMRAIAEDPEYALAHYNLGQTLFLEGRLDEAATSYHRAIALNPENAEMHFLLGAAYSEQGEYRDAIPIYEKAIALDPTHVQARCNLGNALTRQGHLNKAIETLKHAVIIEPEHATSHYNLGVAQFKQGNLSESIKSYQRAIKIKPDEATFHTSLGQSLFSQGRSAKATQSLQTAITLDPRHKEAHYHLGITFHSQGRLKEATTSFARAIGVDPDYIDAHYRMGLALRDQGQPEEALRSYRAALGIDPQFVYAHNGIGIILRNQGKEDEAIDCFGEAIRIDSNFAPAHLNLGDTLKKQGRLDEALASLERAYAIWSSKDDPYSARWARTASAMIESVSGVIAKQSTLLQILNRERDPASADEFEAAEVFGYDLKRHQDVVAMTESVLATRPGLIRGDWGLYNSACSAALLAANVEIDLPAGDRTRVRNLARSWLSTQVAKWCALLSEAGASTADAARTRLRHTLQDPDFSSVRGPALDSLSETEGKQWREVWLSIENALRSKEG